MRVQVARHRNRSADPASVSVPPAPGGVLARRQSAGNRAVSRAVQDDRLEYLESVGLIPPTYGTPASAAQGPPAAPVPAAQGETPRTAVPQTQRDMPPAAPAAPPAAAPPAPEDLVDAARRRRRPADLSA